MPELPEVHTIASDLIKYVKNARITDTWIEDTYPKVSDPTYFSTSVINTDIKDVKRIAKNIVLELSNDMHILVHLAMTGKLLLRKPEHTSDRWLRVQLNLTKNEKDFHLRFCDMRMFGKVQLLTTPQLEELINSYGPEPLDKNLTPERFLTLLSSKKTNIKNVLLDQSIVAGLGNVYATDALWLAQIHPQTNTTKLTLSQATKLLEACREILAEGISNRGISMSDYVDLFGKKGNQQSHFRVYSQEKCKRCNSDIEFIQLNGRGTYFCPICQPKDNQQRLM